MYLHFKTIAESTDLSIILYTVPSRTNVSIDIETVEKLSRIKNIVGIKDTSGELDYKAAVDIAYARALYRLSQEGKKGAITVLDVAPKYLSEESYDSLLNFI